MKDIMLKTNDLSYSIGDKELIHKISLSVPKGSFVGLVGPNGSGKSTLLKTIYRANKASEGTIYLDGKSMDRMSNREMAKKFAVVTQENEINFEFTVMEMMMTGRYAHHSIFSKRDYQDEKICRDALKLVGMEKFADRNFLSLSGGEKQRVLIASAFSRETNLILLDEPTNHLDLGCQFMIMDLLRSKKDTTVFTSVHDLNMALKYCDSIIVLKKGRIVAFGNTKEVLTEELMKEVFRVRVKKIKENDGTEYFHYLGAI